MTFSELPISFSGGARGCVLRSRWEADAQAKELGATMSHGIVFKNDRHHDADTWLSSVSYLTGVRIDERGYVDSGDQIAYWSPSTDIFYAFEKPRRYVTPITCPEIRTSIEKL